MASNSVHLLVLIHGMWGNPDHLSELARIIREQKGETNSDVELRVLKAETNSGESTYDGIDWGGERVAEEVLNEVETLKEEGKKVVHFSVTGYSLGGLLARYVVGALYQRNFFDDVIPMNFNTFATPHVGLPKYPSFLSAVASSLGPRILSRTGEQFYCVDKWSNTGLPLLEVMADPKRVFWQALTLFSHKRIYANAVNDFTVPFVTSSISDSDPFLKHTINGIEVEMHEGYSPLIKTYSVISAPTPAPKPSFLTPKWFKSFKPLHLPPRLQFPFPFNILVYVLLPILIPSFISFALIRFSLATRSSRARIKLLEEDESNSQKLINTLGQLEKQVESAVVDIIEDTIFPLTAASEPQTPTNAPGEEEDSDGKRDAALLTPTQRRLVTLLNNLPGLKKELAFIHPARNSHAIIICRDVKHFEAHKQGEGVIRHWASVFVV